MRTVQRAQPVRNKKVFRNKLLLYLFGIVVCRPYPYWLLINTLPLFSTKYGLVYAHAAPLIVLLQHRRLYDCCHEGVSGRRLDPAIAHACWYVWLRHGLLQRHSHSRLTDATLLRLVHRRLASFTPKKGPLLHCRCSFLTVHTGSRTAHQSG